MLQQLAVAALRLRRWRLVGTRPDRRKYLIVLAPHTCNWDWPLAMLAAAGFGLRLSWLGKHTIFRWPVAGILRGMGGIPVHRDRREKVVEQVVAAYAAADSLVVGMTPEGTRTETPYWKSGFYHMAHKAGVPIVPASIDGATHQIRLGSPIPVSGDVCQDMDALRSFYAGTAGIHPDKAGPVRLREEEAPLPSA